MDDRDVPGSGGVRQESPLLLRDVDVRALLTPERAVRAARRALEDAYAGELQGPPRLHAELRENRLVFTAGGYADGPIGFRVYGLWPGSSDQAVVVWSGDGRLTAVVIGSELGTRRTGALGAVAVDVLARSEAVQVGLIGSGAQAWSQLWAIRAVRPVARVTVFSPIESHRLEFAARARSELGIDSGAVSEPAEAVRGADILVLATRSQSPVIDASWVEPGTHVNTVGPKTRSGHETPPELASRASVVVSDAPGQAAAYGEPFFTPRPLQHLGRFLVGRPPTRGPDEITLYCSTGLAGSEVVIADALVRAAGQSDSGSRTPA